MKDQLDELWGHAQTIAAEELKDTAPLGYSEIDPDATFMQMKEDHMRLPITCIKRLQTTGHSPHHIEAEYHMICPMGQQMHHIRAGQKITLSGFVQIVSRYQALRCEGCPMRGICHGPDTESEDPQMWTCICKHEA